MLAISTMTSITTMAAAAISSKPSCGFLVHSVMTIGQGGEPLLELAEVEQRRLAGQAARGRADQDQRRRLAERPGQREDRAGDDARARRRAARGCG